MKKPTPQRGIKVADCHEEALRILAGGNKDDGPLRLLRQLLIAETFVTREKGQEINAALEPLTRQLQKLHEEMDQLIAGTRATEPDEWIAHVHSAPLRPAIIALMLVSYDDRLREEGARAVREKEQARTVGARAAVKKKADQGETLQARAMAELVRCQRNGQRLMDRSLPAQIAEKVGCDPATVRNARKALLDRKTGTGIP